jgi:PHP family Zn ribbon phosphoesterase
MRFDLHIHSCLSPCGSLEMSPCEIAAKARERGIQGIAITDHNSARNAPAFKECCERIGISALFGLEVTSAEEVHMLSIFDTVEQSLSMTEWVYGGLIERVNKPEVFGDQPVVTADNEIIEMEWRMLGLPTAHTVYEIGEKTHALGGLFIACHIDRPYSSVFSQLGVLSGEEGFDAMELSRTANLDQWYEKISGYAVIRSSDSHHIDDIGLAWTEAGLKEFSVAELKRVFLEKSTSISPHITSF